jgi:hypothetical protein
MRSLVPDVIKECNDILPGPKLGRRATCLAEAASVEPDDCEVPGKRRYLVVPHPPITEAGVQQDDGMTGTSHVKRDRCIADSDKLRFGHLSSTSRIVAPVLRFSRADLTENVQ